MLSFADVQWDFVYGLMENAIYGGRVDNLFDMRILVAYLRKIFSSETLPGSGRAKQRLCDEFSIPPSADLKVSSVFKVPTASGDMLRLAIVSRIIWQLLTSFRMKINRSSLDCLRTSAAPGSVWKEIASSLGFVT